MLNIKSEKLCPASRIHLCRHAKKKKKKYMYIFIYTVKKKINKVNTEKKLPACALPFQDPWKFDPPTPRPF